MNSNRRKSFGLIGGFFALLLGLTPLDVEARRGRKRGGRSTSRRKRYTSSFRSSYTPTNNSYSASNNKTRTASKSYVVTASVLNVRKAASADAEVLGKVARGMKLRVLSSSNPLFYQIAFDSQVGYVSKQYVSYK